MVEDSRHPKRIYLLLVARSTDGYLLGRDMLYQRRIKSLEAAVEDIVSDVTEDLMTEISHGGCVDEFMQDQLVIFQALAKGRSEINAGTNREASLHTKTAWWIVKELLGVEFQDNGSCEGVGFLCGNDNA